VNAGPWSFPAAVKRTAGRTCFHKASIARCSAFSRSTMRLHLRGLARVAATALHRHEQFLLLVGMVREHHPVEQVEQGGRLRARLLHRQRQRRQLRQVAQSAQDAVVAAAELADRRMQRRRGRRSRVAAVHGVSFAVRRLLQSRPPARTVLTCVKGGAAALRAVAQAGGQGRPRRRGWRLAFAP
jgi:hypothetical protein